MPSRMQSMPRSPRVAEHMVRKLQSENWDMRKQLIAHYAAAAPTATQPPRAESNAPHTCISAQSLAAAHCSPSPVIRQSNADLSIAQAEASESPFTVRTSSRLQVSPSPATAAHAAGSPCLAGQYAAPVDRSMRTAASASAGNENQQDAHMAGPPNGTQQRDVSAGPQMAVGPSLSGPPGGMHASGSSVEQSHGHAHGVSQQQAQATPVAGLQPGATGLQTTAALRSPLLFQAEQQRLKRKYVASPVKGVVTAPQLLSPRTRGKAPCYAAALPQEVRAGLNGMTDADAQAPRAKHFQSLGDRVPAPCDSRPSNTYTVDIRAAQPVADMPNGRREDVTMDAADGRPGSKAATDGASSHASGGNHVERCAQQSADHRACAPPDVQQSPAASPCDHAAGPSLDSSPANGTQATAAAAAAAASGHQDVAIAAESLRQLIADLMGSADKSGQGPTPKVSLDHGCRRYRFATNALLAPA